MTTGFTPVAQLNAFNNRKDAKDKCWRTKYFIGKC